MKSVKNLLLWSNNRSEKRLSNFKLANVLTVCAIFILHSASFAGELLRFKSGDVNTEAKARLMTLTPKTGKNIFVVQFKSVIGAEDRQNLTTLGAIILRYIPDDALVVRADSRMAMSIARSSLNVRSVMPFQAEWKTSQNFEPLSVFSRRTRGSVVVQLFPGENSIKVLDFIQTLPGAKVLSSSDRTVIVELSRSQVENVSEIEGVEWIEPAPRIESLSMRGLIASEDLAPVPNGDYTDLTGLESGTKLINAPAAYGRGFTGKGQIISMADTGMDSGDPNTIHGDFKARVPVGYSFGHYAKTWDDPMGHGTHVAGSVMGSGLASGGQLKGTAYEATFVPEGMWSPLLGGLTVPAKITDLFSKAYSNGARIHTNSWGSAQSFGAYDSMASQVDEFMAANPDMLVMFAAGNSGIDKDKDGRVDPNSLGTPATAKNVLSVGASKNYVLKGGLQIMLKETRLKDNWPIEPLASSRMSENSMGMAAFSSRGPTDDGRMKPDVVAPGTNILSVRSQVKDAEPLWGLYNTDYAWSGGTSMSTPIVAGGVALVRQYLIEDRKIANPSAALMKAILMHTATDLFPGQFGEVGATKGQEIITTRPNIDEGYGRVDLDKATDLGAAILVDEKKGLSTGEAHTYPVKVSSQSKLVVTLVYTDAAGSAAAKKALVNDLDLILADANGNETSLNDHLNNAEMIQASIGAGEYVIKVKGLSVPTGPANGKQPYALVVGVN